MRRLNEPSRSLPPFHVAPVFLSFFFSFYGEDRDLSLSSDGASAHLLLCSLHAFPECVQPS